MKCGRQGDRGWRSCLARRLARSYALALLAGLFLPTLAQAAKPGALDPSFGDDGKVRTTYSDFGTPVSVEAPPAADVEELPAQLSSLLNN